MFVTLWLVEDIDAHVTYFKYIKITLFKQNKKIKTVLLICFRDIAHKLNWSA